jgi:predicted permease
VNRLLNWLRRGRLEDSLDRELQYHFERRTADHLAAGLPESEARRRAMLEIGGLTQVREEVRDVWLTRWFRDFLYDLRFSIRSYGRTPAFTATAVLSLALGIGATTAIYSLVDQVVLHALPVRQPERLVRVDWNGEFAGHGFGSFNLMPYPLCRDLETQTRLFDGVLCRAALTINLSTGGDPRPVAAEIVSGSYFHVLGITAALGRVLGPDDDLTPGTSPVVVLAYDFWKSQLGADPAVVGRKVLMNQHPMTVVGIAAPGFHGVDVGEVPAIWIPASMSADAVPGFRDMLDHRQRWMQILARLRDGISPEQAQAGVQAWFKAVLDQDSRLPGFPKLTPEARARYFASTLGVTPAPQGHSVLRRRLTQPLWVLLAATGLLLGLACLNVAGLFLARGSARAREISTRLALGASRGRIGRQLLADSVVLATIGGLLGIVLAPIAMRSLIAFLPSDVAATALRSGLDARLLGFALLISVAAGVLSGLVPALHAGRNSLITSRRERGGAAGGVRLRKMIVTAQIAFSLVLVIGAVLFIRTLTGLLSKGPGFATAKLVEFNLDPRRNGYKPEDASRVLRRVFDEVRVSPVVQGAAMTRFAMLTGGSWNQNMTIQAGERIPTDREVNLNSVSPGFFAFLGVRLVEGRDFEPRDFRRQGDKDYRAAIVNEAFVKRYLHGRSPLGSLICFENGPDAQPNIPIIGVVETFSYRGLREDSEQAFFPVFDDAGGQFYVRSRGTTEEAAQAIRAVVRGADPALPINNLRTVDDQVSRSLNTERILAALSTAFGVLALFLSVVGLYGVMSYVVTQRTREIGIRIALGASSRAALWLVLRDAALMIAGGAAIAVLSVGALGQYVQSQLFGVGPMNPTSIAAATVLLGAASFAAAFIPAWRAARLNPTEALRLD